MLSSSLDTSRKKDIYRVMIFGSKALIFRKLFDEICKEVGGYTKAIKAINTSNHVIQDLYKQRISYENAKLLISKHKELVGKK